jgi:hypothetical protein
MRPSMWPCVGRLWNRRDLPSAARKSAPWALEPAEHWDTTMILIAFRQDSARRPPPSAASRTAPPFWGDELRALRRLRRESEMSSFVVSASHGPFTAGFARVTERAPDAVGLKVYLRMLRHACGYTAHQPLRLLTRANSIMHSACLLRHGAPPGVSVSGGARSMAARRLHASR